MIWGVRSRTTVLATLLVLVTLVVAGTALVASQRRTLTDSVDEVLARQSDRITANLDAGQAIAAQGDDESFALVVNAKGQVTASTANAPAPENSLFTDGKAGSRTADFGKGDFRVLSKRHGDLMIHTATPLDDVEESTATLTRSLAVAVPAVTLLFAGLVWLLVGRVLRPVEEIRRQVAEISGTSLDRRVPDPGTSDEIARLAQTMNDMLARLEESSSRQQRFVADASHELRSPLARIRAELEVDAAHPETADLHTTQANLLEDTVRLQRLVADLLLLARSDHARSPARSETFDLDDLVLRVVQQRGSAGRFDTSSVSAAQVKGDPVEVARAISNVLDNAERYGGPNVTLALGEEAGEAVLSVADDGPGIPAEFRDRIFERFARFDEARTGSEGGTGLGLAIARDNIVAMGGALEIDPTHTKGARFILRMPLA